MGSEVFISDGGKANKGGVWWLEGVCIEEKKPFPVGYVGVGGPLCLPLFLEKNFEV